MTPFLAYHLKGKGSLDLPEALTFRTGTNEWVRHDSWPPKQNIAVRQMYFHEGRRLSFDPPSAADATAAFDSYVSDPANPIPYRHRPIELNSGWTTWQIEDQRFVDHRPDVLSWVSDTLTNNLVVSGKISADLFASTTGTDSDWIVKVIDVYPEKYPDDPKMGGYELMIAGDVLRGRYRNSLEKPEPIPSGAVTHYTIGFPANDHVFLKGHRVMVQVQSTWFPVIDRNPQHFVPNIFNASAEDYQKATQHIYRGAKSASHILLPVETQ